MKKIVFVVLTFVLVCAVVFQPIQIRAGGSDPDANAPGSSDPTSTPQIHPTLAMSPAPTRTLSPLVDENPDCPDGWYGATFPDSLRICLASTGAPFSFEVIDINLKHSIFQRASWEEGNVFPTATTCPKGYERVTVVKEAILCYTQEGNHLTVIHNLFTSEWVSYGSATPRAQVTYYLKGKYVYLKSNLYYINTGVFPPGQADYTKDSFRKTEMEGPIVGISILVSPPFAIVQNGDQIVYVPINGTSPVDIKDENGNVLEDVNLLNYLEGYPDYRISPSMDRNTPGWWYEEGTITDGKYSFHPIPTFTPVPTLTPIPTDAG